MILAIIILITLAAGLLLLLNGIRKKHKTLTVISGLATLVIGFLLLFFTENYLTEVFFPTKIERSGVVIDKETGKPLEGVPIELHSGYINDKLILNPKVVTDKDGHFSIKQKISKNALFVFSLEGYYGYTSSLQKQGDTIKLERVKTVTE